MNYATLILFSMLSLFTLKAHAQQDMDPFQEGCLQFVEGEVKESLVTINEAIQEEGHRPELYNIRGVIHHEMKNYDEAHDDYTKAISLDSGYAFAFYNRGVAHYSEKRYADAIHDFDYAVSIYPNDADFYFNRGLSKEKLDLHAPALVDYSEAVKIDPEYKEAYHQLGVLHHKMGNTEKACADLRTAYSLGHFETPFTIVKICGMDEMKAISKAEREENAQARQVYKEAKAKERAAKNYEKWTRRQSMKNGW